MLSRSFFSSSSPAQSGALFAIAAYFMWGLAPMYFKALVDVPALEILMHRIVWSALILGLLIVVFKQSSKVMQACRSPKMLGTLVLSGVILGFNWGLFIWAVNNDQLLEASLGYYINPLFNVLFGFVFLGERFRRLQQIAVGMAVVGVAILIITFGDVPMIALALATSFSIYGLIRKQIAVDSMPGLFIETLLMLPFALIYWFSIDTPTSQFALNSLELNTLLILAGVVTTAPLLCFTAAARRIRYSTLGFFQYIGPSLMFGLAVFLYQEPFTLERIVTFAFVWSALGVFAFDAWRASRNT